MSRRRAVPGRGAGYIATRCAPLWCWPGRRRTGFVASGCTPLLPLLIEAMERHGHGGLDDQKRQQLLAMSAATIDRILKGVRASATGQRRRKGSTAIRRSVPVRTFSDWNNFLVVDISNEQAPVCVASLADQRLVEALWMRVQDGYAYIARVHEAALKLLNS